MATIAMILPLTRRNPSVLPRRDIVLAAGDTLRLDLTLVERDEPDAEPLDLSGLGVFVMATVLGRNGRQTTIGTVQGEAGRVEVVLGDGTISLGSGVLEVSLDAGGNITTLFRGVLQVRQAAALGRDGQAVLGDVFQPVLGDDYRGVEV